MSRYVHKRYGNFVEEDKVMKAAAKLARGIEPPTCGLQICSDPTTDHLTPQETTNHDTAELTLDGAGLSCPGSSVVAGDE